MFMFMISSVSSQLNYSKTNMACPHHHLLDSRRRPDCRGLNTPLASVANPQTTMESSSRTSCGMLPLLPLWGEVNKLYTDHCLNEYKIIIVYHIWSISSTVCSYDKICHTHLVTQKSIQILSIFLFSYRLLCWCDRYHMHIVDNMHALFVQVKEARAAGQLLQLESLK